jgi:hypothetical protein
MLIKIDGKVVSTEGKTDCTKRKTRYTLLGVDINYSATALLTLSDPPELTGVEIEDHNDGANTIAYNGPLNEGNATLKVDGNTYTILGHGGKGGNVEMVDFYLEITCP